MWGTKSSKWRPGGYDFTTMEDFYPERGTDGYLSKLGLMLGDLFRYLKWIFWLKNKMQYIKYL